MWVSQFQGGSRQEILGAASVYWDFKTKSWVFAKDLPVGTVFAAVPLSPELMKESGISDSQSYIDFVISNKNK